MRRHSLTSCDALLGACCEQSAARKAKRRRQMKNCLIKRARSSTLSMSMPMSMGLQSAPCIRNSAFCPRRSARLSCKPAARPRVGARQRGQVPATAAARDADMYYANWLALPIQPGSVRRTQRTTAGPGIFLFEQTQVRSTGQRFEGRATHV